MQEAYSVSKCTEQRNRVHCCIDANGSAQIHARSGVWHKVTKSLYTITGLRHGAGDIQILTAVYRICHQAAQPSIEPYNTWLQRYHSHVQPAAASAVTY